MTILKGLIRIRAGIEIIAYGLFYSEDLALIHHITTIRALPKELHRGLTYGAEDESLQGALPVAPSCA